MRRGDRVGVAALSGPVEPNDLEIGLQALRDFGFDPVVARNVTSKRGLFAGCDDDRLDGFHELVSDEAVRAIFFARGGHGVLRLLPRIDWRLLARHPRAYVGYSDLTPFLLEVVRRLRTASFHGPMVAKDLARGLSAEERASLLGALAGKLPATIPVRAVEPSEEVSGTLLGGCLSLLTAVLGTPFEVDLRGAILFWEDVDEPLYRLDRMLIHLRLSGNLERIAAMVVGCTELRDLDGESGLSNVLAELRGAYSWPLAMGCPCGHLQPNLTLPLGLPAILRPQADELLVGLETGG